MKKKRYLLHYTVLYCVGTAIIIIIAITAIIIINTLQFWCFSSFCPGSELCSASLGQVPPAIVLDINSTMEHSILFLEVLCSYLLNTHQIETYTLL